MRSKVEGEPRVTLQKCGTTGAGGAPRRARSIILFMATAIAWGLYAGPVSAEPFEPAGDGLVLERLSDPADATRRELRELRDELSREPENLDLALGLAQRYIEIGRAELDPRYNGYAEAALEPWWDLAAPPTQVVVLRAILRQNRHDFEGALADLAQALDVDPRNPQAWLTRAVVLQVQGEYDAATESCLRLRGRTSALVTYACIGSVAGLNGAAADGYRLLIDALGRAPDAKAGIRLWVLTLLGELATRMGADAAAEEHFRAALALGERSGYLLGAYADFLLDRGRASEVRALLAGEARIDGLLLRLALAESELDHSDLSSHVTSLKQRFDASRRRGDTVHRREEARFTLHLLNEPDEALRLAKENWLAQKEPWDARILLEAALAANRPQEAADLLDWLAMTGLEDERIQKLTRWLVDAQG